MDVISHAIIGAIIAQVFLWQLDDDKTRRWWVLFGACMGAAPDITNIPLYLHLGAINDRFLWIPNHSDWEGYRSSFPLMVMGWEATHSLVLVIFIGGILYKIGKPIWTAVCWGSHSFVDILCHTGEWSTVPLWPLDIKIEGWGDPWKWDPLLWAASNLTLLTFLFLVSYQMKRWRDGYPNYLLNKEAWYPTPTST